MLRPLSANIADNGMSPAPSRDCRHGLSRHLRALLPAHRAGRRALQRLPPIGATLLGTAARSDRLGQEFTNGDRAAMEIAEFAMECIRAADGPDRCALTAHPASATPVRLEVSADSETADHVPEFVSAVG